MIWVSAFYVRLEPSEHHKTPIVVVVVTQACSQRRSGRSHPLRGAPVRRESKLGLQLAAADLCGSSAHPVLLRLPAATARPGNQQGLGVRANL